MQFNTLPEIQVAGHTFKIILKDAATVDGDHNVGETWLQDNTILVALKTMGGDFRPVSALEETLLHEDIHTVSEIFNVGLSEDQVRQLSQGLYQILKQYGLELISDV